MSTRRIKGRGADRDGTMFFALPHLVVDSPGYRACSHSARSLLVDIGRQFDGDNNGKLVITRKWYEPLGWTSDDVVYRAKKELLAAGLLLETRRGARPNRAGLYALNFFGSTVTSGLDVTVSQIKASRGIYMRPDPELLEKRTATRKSRRQPIKVRIR